MSEDFLGRGWAFPPVFDVASRGVELVEGVEDIQQSLQILVGTALGERVMRPDYGCNLKTFQFEPSNSAFRAYMRDIVYKAVVFHEPRIKVDDVIIRNDDELDGRLIIEVTYRIRRTNTPNNFVFDFYLQ